MSRSLILGLACALTLHAQPPIEEPVPVNATMEVPAEIALGTTFQALVKVTIDDTYHIYGMRAIDVEKPTSFAVAPTSARRFELAGSPVPSRKAEEKREEFEKYDYWEGAIEFSVPLRATSGDTGEVAELELIMSYMACTSEFCLRPAEIKLKKPIRLLAGKSSGGGEEKPPEVPRNGQEKSTVPSIVGPAKSATAYLEPSTIAPGALGELVIELPPGALSKETAIAPEDLRLPAELKVVGIPTLTTTSKGTLIRAQVELDREQVNERDLPLVGSVRIGKDSIEFGGMATVRVPLLKFLWVAIVAALFALLTPCVFPMIPITISFFTKQSEKSKRPPLVMGLVYGLGIVVSFTAIGAIFTAAIKAGGANAFAAHPLTQGFIATLFIVFALSLFGMFEIQLPSSLLNLVGGAQGKGGFVGVWLLGLLFAVTSFTCTAPFVGSILAGAASTGQWTRPILGMVAFSTVLALPFVYLSAFPARIKNLPKSGSWLNKVKVSMGFIELAAAFKFLGSLDMVMHWGIFTRTMVISAWAAIFFAMGLYLLGGFRLPHDSPAEKIGVFSLIFALLCIGFGIYVLKGLSGEPLDRNIEPYLPREEEHRTPEGRRSLLLRDLKAGGTGALGPGAASGSIEIHLKNDYEGAVAQAKAKDRLVFLNFTGYT